MILARIIRAIWQQNWFAVVLVKLEMSSDQIPPGLFRDPWSQTLRLMDCIFVLLLTH